MTPLTVACVWVRGEYPYTVEYVTRLRAMVAHWIGAREFAFCCLTDRPDELPGSVIPIPVVKLAGFAPWTKLELFNPVRAWPGRVLYLDLDSLVVAPLAPIVDYPASFAITADPPKPGQKTRDSYKRAIVRRFNSSVMAWDGGTHTDLYTRWTPAAADRLSGDQDWTGEQLPAAAAMPRTWFPRISEAKQPPWSDEAKVILTKHPKNHVLAERHAWFKPLWGPE